MSRKRTDGAPVSPLGAADYDRVQQGLRAIHDANQLIAQGHASGLDVRAHAEMSNYYQQYLEAIRSNFFSNGRPTP